MNYGMQYIHDNGVGSISLSYIPTICMTVKFEKFKKNKIILMPLPDKIWQTSVKRTIFLMGINLQF